MSWTKTDEEICVLRELGKRHAEILDIIEAHALPGVSTAALEELTERLIVEGGHVPAFKGYCPEGVPMPFPAALCVAPNNVVVHGMPNVHPYELKDGDILGIDIGLKDRGLVTDGGRTLAIGTIDSAARNLLAVTKLALKEGIAAARAGNSVGDIGAKVEAVVREHKLGLVRDLCGHGVGHKVHEEPQIPNYGKAGTGEELVPGMVLAIEPMVNEGSGAVTFSDNGYTVYTRDGSRSAHFEHTVVVTDGEPIIITAR